MNERIKGNPQKTKSGPTHLLVTPPPDTRRIHVTLVEDATRVTPRSSAPHAISPASLLSSGVIVTAHLAFDYRNTVTKFVISLDQSEKEITAALLCHIE